MYQERSGQQVWCLDTVAVAAGTAEEPGDTWALGDQQERNQRHGIPNPEWMVFKKIIYIFKAGVFFFLIVVLFIFFT